MAQNTGIINGTLMGLYIDGVKVAVLTSNSIAQSRPTRETANKDSGYWITRLPNRGSWNASGSAFFQFEDSAVDGFSMLKTAMDARTAITCMVSTENASDLYLSGSGYLTELSADFPDDENSSYTFNIDGDGALTEYTNT